MQPSDLELVQKAAGGDRTAFHTLVDRHARALFKVALSLSRSRADAEDVLQETFVGAFQGLRGFGGRSSVRTWLTRILMRQAAKAWKQTKRSSGSLTLDSAEESARDTEALSVGSATTHVDQRIDLAKVLETLSPEFREVIVLRELRGMAYTEIAETLGIPQGTVESRLFRARAELRGRLKSYLSAR